MLTITGMFKQEGNSETWDFPRSRRQPVSVKASATLAKKNKENIYEDNKKILL